MKTVSKPKIHNHQAPNNNNLALVSHEATPKINAHSSIDIPDTPLFMRNTATDEAQPIVDNERAALFTLGSKIYALTEIKYNLIFIQENLDPTFKQDFYEDLDLLTLLNILTGLNLYMITNIHSKGNLVLIEKFDNLSTIIATNAILQMHNHPQAKFSIDDIESIQHSFFYYTLIITCYQNDQKIFKEYIKALNTENHKSQEIEKSNTLNSILAKSINNFERIIINNYYPLLRIITSHQAESAKLAKLKSFLGPNCQDFADPKLRETINRITYLKAFTDFLTKVNEAPKTLNNLKLIVKLSTVFYETFNKQYKTLCRTYRNSSHPPFLRNHFLVLEESKNLNLALNTLLQTLDRENSWLPSSSFNQSKQTPPQSSRKNHTQIAKTPPAPSKKILISPAPTPQPPILETYSPIPLEAKTQDTSSNSLDLTSQNPLLETEIDDVECELSDYFEAIRRLFEKDREAKLTLKEEKKKAEKEAARLLKEKQAEELYEAPSIADAIKSITPPSIVYLSPSHQDILQKVYDPQIKHGQISRQEIENLIINGLKGRIDGNEGIFQIRWGNSKKLAGTFEVAHTGSYKGLLLKNQVENVRDAINVGVQFNHISADLIPKF